MSERRLVVMLSRQLTVFIMFVDILLIALYFLFFY